jgi:putative hemolysin
MEILIIFLLIIINGVFAMSEIAIVSARKSRLQNLAEQGSRRARIALALAEDPTRFLSTVQIGITLIGILAGAFGGATVAHRLDTTFSQVEALQPYSNVLAVALVVLLTTYLSLVVGELAPKRLGLQNPERIALIVAGPMRRLSFLTAPVVSLLSGSTHLLLRLLGVHQFPRPDVTEDDVTALILQGTQAGVFERTEHSMVVGVLSLDNVRVDAVMTPRTEIEWLDLNDPLSENLQKISTSTHSRFPVAHEQLDQIVGILAIKDVLKAQLAGQSVDLKVLSHQPPYVPGSQVLSQTLETFKHTGEHIALVVDEHGGIDGLVTITDLLEEIIGEVGQSPPQIVRRPDGSWLIDGLLPVHDLQEILDVEEDELDDEDFSTLGGFVMHSLGRIPAAADAFEWQGFRFEVMDMDGRRVDKVLVSRVKAGDHEQPTER